MTFEDFPYPRQENSFIFHDEVLDYIKSYAKHFKIEPHVKFYKRVINIEPIDNASTSGGQWSVDFTDVLNQSRENRVYDAVICCNGHYSKPKYPRISGIEGFQGGLKHSHSYRNPDCYKDRRVLVIGAGPSGIDISGQIASVARLVIIINKKII